MKIGELFLQLGIKGTDQSKKALGGVKDSLSEVGSMSLEAKAAILGVIYGLEHMMSNSAKAGMDLQKFANYTGLSTDMLQRWQYMARQSGVSADEMAGSMKSAQMAMDKMNTGQGAPKGLEAISRSLQSTGSSFDINKAVNDTTYLMNKLREYAKTTADTPQRANDWLSSFGLSEGVIQMMRTSNVQLDKIRPSNLYSNDEIGQLSKVEVAWQNLGDKINKAFGHLTAKEGLGMIDQIVRLTDSVVKLSEALVKIAQTLHLIEGIGIATESVAGTVSDVSDMLGASQGDATAKKNLAEKNQQTLAVTKASIEAGWAGQIYRKLSAPLEAMDRIGTSLFAPGMKPITEREQATTINQNPTINVHNHGVKDAQDAAGHVKTEVQKAYRQLSTQRQGS